MHTTLADASVLSGALRNELSALSGVTTVICPPLPWLVPVSELLRHRPAHLKLGAQDAYFIDEGPVTGAVSIAMLKGLIEYLIVGHSERRRIFRETNAIVNDKIHTALRHGIRPVIAVGEYKKVHHEPKKHWGRPTRVEAQSDIREQLRECLDGVSRTQAKQLIVVYEPVWAISSGLGKGEPADGVYVNHVAGIIREWLTRRFGAHADEIPILYGGSVTAENAPEYAGQPEISGALVGAASLSAREFAGIAQAFAR